MLEGENDLAKSAEYEVPYFMILNFLNTFN